MKKDLPLSVPIPLFRGIHPDEFPRMLRCLHARTTGCRKGEIVLLEGQPVTEVGVVLSGRVQVVKEDFAGTRNILAEFGPGSLFAESYACARSDRLPVTVVSIADGEILWLDYAKIVAARPTECGFHTRLIENMLSILASRNILLSRKIEHISRRTTREKLMAYLSDQAATQGSGEFDIPFNRQELADYLCVDRSALSYELGRMQKEGLIRFRLNHFRLLAP